MYPYKENAIEQYYLEAESFGREGLLKILDEGKRWDLSETLRNGGSAIFPHTFIKQCGFQIASVVHACLNSSAQNVVVLGVVHSLTDELAQVRKKAKIGLDVSQEPSRGIFPANHPILKKEFSLYFFKLLWDIEVSRRSHTIPKLEIKYPLLAISTPQSLPGIDQLKKMRKNTVFVATADLCHYGKAYDCQKEKPLCSESLSFAENIITEGFEILEKKNYVEHTQYCYDNLSDGIDVCLVLRELLGPLKAEIKDIKLVDVKDLYQGSPSPSWVAATLVEMKKIS